ncbi:hypothetical protein FG147_02430 [Thauera sp. UPWRP]|nr:hypothetical protein FG147_02430 [Thauera sp. UPWRP]
MSEHTQGLLGLPAVEAELARIERTSTALAVFQGKLRRARPARTLRVDYDEVHSLLLLAEADLNQATTTLRDTLDSEIRQHEVARSAWEFKRHMYFMKMRLDESMTEMRKALDRVALPGYEV